MKPRAIYKLTCPFVTVGMKGGSREENSFYDVGGKDIVLQFISFEIYDDKITLCLYTIVKYTANVIENDY